MNIIKIRESRDLILSWPWPSFLKKMLRHWLSISFIKYLIVGISTFLLQIFFLYFFTEIAKLDKVLANIFAALIATLYGFYMSNKWSFKNNSKKQGSKLAKFTFLTAFNYAFDTLLAFPLLAVTWGINQYLTKVFITGIVVVWNFFLYKLWIFKSD